MEGSVSTPTPTLNSHKRPQTDPPGGTRHPASVVYVNDYLTSGLVQTLIESHSKIWVS